MLKQVQHDIFPLFTNYDTVSWWEGGFSLLYHPHPCLRQAGSPSPLPPAGRHQRGRRYLYDFHGSCLYAEVRSACLREAASAKAGHAGVGDKLIM